MVSECRAVHIPYIFLFTSQYLARWDKMCVAGGGEKDCKNDKCLFREESWNGRIYRKGDERENP